MIHQLWRYSLLVLLLVACTPIQQPPQSQERFVQADASLNNVHLRQDGAVRPLLSPDRAQLHEGDGVQVDEAGRALLRFSDFLTIEVLRAGDLDVYELDLNEQSALAAFGQSGGAFVNKLEPSAAGVKRRVTIDSDFAVITATGTHFLVVKEANSPLEWVIALDAGPNDLTVTAKNGSPASSPVTSGEARWIAPVDNPSQSILYDVEAVDEWLDAVTRGQPVSEVGKVLWPHANIRVDTGAVAGALTTERLVELGGVVIKLDAQRAGEAVDVEVTDCNGDGIMDLFLHSGLLHMDFRRMDQRVENIDLTIMAERLPAAGLVTVFDPAVQVIQEFSFDMTPGEGKIVSLRADQPYHYADLTLDTGCFLGISITPPNGNGETTPVSAVTSWPPADLSPSPIPTSTTVSPTPTPQPPTPTTVPPTPTPQPPTPTTVPPTPTPQLPTPTATVPSCCASPLPTSSP